MTGAWTSGQLGRPLIRVLVVDDHPTVRLAVANVIEAARGLALVGEAGDGQQAMERVRQVEPDVVLMDVKMPVMCGIEATRRLVLEHPDVRVLMFSAECGPGIRREARQAGAAGFLVKGCRGRDVVRAIHAVNDGKSVWPA